MNEVDRLKTKIHEIQESCNHSNTEKKYAYDSAPPMGFIESVCLDCSRILPREKIDAEEAFLGFWINRGRAWSRGYCGSIEQMKFRLPIKDIKYEV